MNLRIDFKNPFWWIWTITLLFIITAIAGWTYAYYIVMAISAFQVILFLLRERSLMAFPTQIRIVYFAWTLLGLWAAGRLFFYALLLLGTIMVVFFGRCSISLVLKYMPWNKNKAPRLI